MHMGQVPHVPKSPWSQGEPEKAGLKNHSVTATKPGEEATGRTAFSSGWGWEPLLPGRAFQNIGGDTEMTTVQLNSEFLHVCKHPRQLWSKAPPFLPHCQTLCYEHFPEVTGLISHRKSFTILFRSKHERQPTFSNAFNNKYWNRGISESPGLTPTPVCLASQCYRGERLCSFHKLDTKVTLASLFCF